MQPKWKEARGVAPPSKENGRTRTPSGDDEYEFEFSLLEFS